MFERDRRKLGVSVSKDGLVMDAERVAQDSGAGPAVRVVRYAVLVPHAGQAPADARYFLRSSALVGKGRLVFLATGWVTPY